MKKLVFLCMLLTSITCSAQEYIKNGRACVSEVCLGDGISELQRIKWLPADVSKIKVTERGIDAINKIYPEKPPSKLHRYLAAQKFDATILGDLPKVSIVCSDDYNTLSGEYKTTAGNSTEVSIRLMPKSDSNYSWQVIHIQRDVSGIANLSQEEESSFKSQIEQRYRELNPMSFGSYSEENGMDKVSYQVGGHWMNLRLMSRDFYTKTKHPSQCNKTVNLD